MKILLTVVMCSGMANTCLPPHTFTESYPDIYSCMVDGYKKAMEKTIEIGVEEVNKHNIYIKFDCKEFIILEKGKQT
jgi:hypothetical protein